ncbi:hypothetical protein VTI74DRAFT_5742 [Chaetomium olivicolor]
MGFATKHPGCGKGGHHASRLWDDSKNEWLHDGVERTGDLWLPKNRASVDKTMTVSGIEEEQLLPSRTAPRCHEKNSRCTNRPNPFKIPRTIKLPEPSHEPTARHASTNACLVLLLLMMLCHTTRSSSMSSSIQPYFSNHKTVTHTHSPFTYHPVAPESNIKSPIHPWPVYPSLALQCQTQHQHQPPS